MKKLYVKEEITFKLKNNIVIEFIIKMLAVFISFLSVPLLLNKLDFEGYGIWITLLSILSFINFSDLGIGNSLKNSAIKYLTIDNIYFLKKYISTSYIIYVLIGLLTGIISFILSFFLDWQLLFNTSNYSSDYLIIVMRILILSSVVNFVMSLTLQLYQAKQKTFLPGLIGLFHNFLFITMLFISSLYLSLDLLIISILYSISIIVPAIIYTFNFFVGNKVLIPRLKFFDLTIIKDIFSTGINFFIIQLAAILIFSSDVFIISIFFGPVEVTNYNLVKKSLSIFTIINASINIPLWSAYGYAINSKDYSFFKKSIKKNILYLLFTIISIGIFILFSPYLFKIWLGAEFIVPLDIMITLALFLVVSFWNNIYAYILNGINDTKFQAITSIFAAFINIPLSIFLGETLGLKSQGVVIASILSLLIFGFLGPIKVLRLLKKLDS